MSDGGHLVLLWNPELWHFTTLVGYVVLQDAAPFASFEP